MKYIYFFTLVFSASVYGFDHSHSKWNQILGKYTEKANGQVLFNYKSLKNNDVKLKAYLAELENITSDEFSEFSEYEKLAFWINAYNAFTVQLIIKNYPVESIKDTGSLFSSPWSKEFIKLLGKKMNLDDIEHGTIRENFKEARIHFAVNCASMGCPSLFQQAFVATKLDEQLEESTKYFLSNRKKNFIRKNTYHLSKIFDWYGDDFKKYHGSVKKFVEKYLGKAEDIEFLDYDWSLNEVK
ncbi:MAG: hypothetical protein CME65_05595 [Halobacteriovoraceae bacterium]|nr:hypothetical protein [Halobacteriovoraceae bacterium]|tara:strand:+ start:767 stop:1489 length:723 start_codon:yes stop_codon:yes gene_type:complete